MICTVSPSALNVAESLSTLSFAQGLKRVTLKAQKKEMVDPQALIQQYQNEIAELKALLREKEGGVQNAATSRSDVSWAIRSGTLLTTAGEERGDGEAAERAEEYDPDVGEHWWGQRGATRRGMSTVLIGCSVSSADGRDAL